MNRRNPFWAFQWLVCATNLQSTETDYSDFPPKWSPAKMIAAKWSHQNDRHNLILKMIAPKWSPKTIRKLPTKMIAEMIGPKWSTKTARKLPTKMIAEMIEPKWSTRDVTELTRTFVRLNERYRAVQRVHVKHELCFSVSECVPLY